MARIDGCGRSNEDLECLGCGAKLGALQPGECPGEARARVAEEAKFRDLIKPIVLEMHRRKLTRVEILKDGGNVILNAE